MAAFSFARAKGVEEDDITGFDPTLPLRLVERYRNGSRRGIAVLVEIDHHPIHGNSQPLCQSDNDSAIRLVRNHERNLTHRHIGFRETPQTQPETVLAD